MIPDIVEIKRLCASGQWIAKVENGKILLHDTVAGETVCIGNVEAVPVVRCKDCKYYREQRPDAWSDNPMRCDHPEFAFDVECYDAWLEVGPEDFCSRGEKRDAKEEV